MKFKLSTSCYFYDKDSAEKLKGLGFEFDEIQQHQRNHLGLSQDYTHDIDITVNPEIEINTVEELVAFSKQWGQLIINGDSIEIYDDNREL
jgi:hypothetical protein